MTEWDAPGYARIAELQEAMAAEAISLLDLKGTERVLDLGCGNGKVTAEIAARVPGGTVVGVVDTSEEDWAHVVATNLTGMWLCMKYEIPEMLKRGKGAIVNNGSVTGLIGAPGAVANVSSKHGVTGLTKSAALEYATQGIRVNAVAPGNVRTPSFARFIAAHPAAETAVLSAVPQGRWCQPEEVADAVIFLCSEAASHITGHVLPVDGGWTAR